MVDIQINQSVNLQSQTANYYQDHEIYTPILLILYTSDQIIKAHGKYERTAI